MKKILGVIVISVLVLTLGLYLFNNKEKDLLTYVTIDINPSVQFVIDNKDVLVEVNALNDEADIALSDLELVGLNIDEATEKYLKRITEIGYIDEFGENNYVTVTAYSNGEELRTKVENKVLEKTRLFLEQRNIYGQVVSKIMTTELKEEADNYNVSNGKMLLIERAYYLNNSLDKEQLSKLTVKEIQQKVKESVNRRYDEKEMGKEAFKQFALEQKDIRLQETSFRLNEIIEEVSNENEDRIKDVPASDRQKVIEELLKERKEQIKKNINRGNNQ
jgi:hypothetical protein